MFIPVSNVHTHAMLEVAVEGYSLSELTQATKQVFKNTLYFLSEGVTKLLTTEHDVPPPESKAVKACLKTFARFNYIESSELLVSVPEGFVGSLSDYSNELLVNNPILIANTLKLLEEYSTYISHVSTVGAFKANKDLEKRIHALYGKQKEITVRFKRDSTMPKAKLGDLFHSKLDVVRFLEDGVKHSGYLYKTKLTPVKLAVDKATIGITGFMENTPVLEDKVSKEAVLCLTSCAELLGKLVDLSALRYFEQRLVIGVIEELAVQLTVEE